MRKLFVFLMMLCAFFAQAQYAIDSAEYFFDIDPGVGRAIRINTARPDSFTVGIPLGSLSVGFHIVAVRTRNDSAKWSLTEARPFYIYGSQLATTDYRIDSAEYFFDTDTGVGRGTPLRVGNSADSISPPNQNQVISLAGLSTGFHILSIRTRNTNGKWALTESRPFYIIQNIATNAYEIVAAEYFVDTDLGVGLCHPYPVLGAPADTVILDSTSIIANYSYGLHKLVFRTQNRLGEWSLSEARDFRVFACTLALSDTIINASCGGAHNGSVNVTVNGGVSPIAYHWNTGSTALNINSLSGGTYTLTATDSVGCRFIDTAFVYEPPTPVGNASASICSGNSYTFYGQNLNSTGSYSHTLNIGGCDSIVTLTLTVNNLPTQPTIARNGMTLSTSAIGVHYQWQRNNTNLPGDTTSALTITQNGSYTLIATDANGCSSTSAAINVTNVGIGEIGNENIAITVQPNPASETCTLSLQNAQGYFDAWLTDMSGREVAKLFDNKMFESHASFSFPVSQYGKGIYLIRVSNDLGFSILKKLVVD